jgi:hypothetical protein
LGQIEIGNGVLAARELRHGALDEMFQAGLPPVVMLSHQL